MLIRHSLLYTLARGLPGVISFLTLAVYTRLLTPELYGRYTLVVVGVSLANSVLFHWLRLGLLRFLPGYGDHPAPLFATLLAGYVAMATVGLVGGGFAILLAPDPAWRILLALAVPLLLVEAWFEINLTLFRSRLDPARYGLFAVVKAVIALAVGSGLILLGFGPAGPLLAMIVAMLVPSVAFAQGLWRGLGWADLAASRVPGLLAYGAPLSATVAFNLVIASSDRFFVAWLLGTDAAGAYAAGYDLGWVGVMSLMMIINLAGYPLVMRAIERAGPVGAEFQLQQNGLLLLAVALPALGLSVLLAPNIAEVVLGVQFHAEATQLIPWIAFAAFLAGGRLYYVNLAFQLSQKTMGALWVTLVAAFFNLGLNWLWIPRFGLLGAAWATVAAYGLALGLAWWFGRRVFPLPVIPISALKLLLGALVMALTLWPLRGWLGPLALVVQVGIGLLAYALVVGLLDYAFDRGRLLSSVRSSGYDP